MNRDSLHRRWIVETAEPAQCPYCGSADTERAAAFGPFHMTEPYICRACGSPFSRIRWRAPGSADTGSAGE